MFNHNQKLLRLILHLSKKSEVLYNKLKRNMSIKNCIKYFAVRLLITMFDKNYSTFNQEFV